MSDAYLYEAVAGWDCQVALAKYDYNMRKIFVVFILGLVSCAGSPSVEAVAPEQIARAEALPESRFFGGKLVQCEDKDRTARKLFNFVIESIKVELNTRLNFREYRASPYSDGQVYEIVIEAKRGDLGETSSNVHILAVRNDCALASIDD
jgi:hypothetical protein